MDDKLPDWAPLQRYSVGGQRGHVVVEIGHCVGVIGVLLWN